LADDIVFCCAFVLHVILRLLVKIIFVILQLVSLYFSGTVSEQKNSNFVFLAKVTSSNYVSKS